MVAVDENRPLGVVEDSFRDLAEDSPRDLAEVVSKEVEVLGDGFAGHYCVVLEVHSIQLGAERLVSVRYANNLMPMGLNFSGLEATDWGDDVS